MRGVCAVADTCGRVCQVELGRVLICDAPGFRLGPFIGVIDAPLLLLYRYAAHAVDNYSVPWLRTAYAGACHGLSSHRPYGPFLAPDGYKSATNRRFATLSFFATTVYRLSAFGCFATPSFLATTIYVKIVNTP